MEPKLYDALKDLRTALPRLAERLRLDLGQDLRSWTHMIDAKLLARLDVTFPVVAAVCGGGSSGKSTLFNAMIGKRVSPTGGRAGLNRRVLFAVPPRYAGSAKCLAELFAPFCSEPAPLATADQIVETGAPLYVVADFKPGNLVVLDTPDFDTGAKGGYVNRETARMALETADILIYVFTNSNYNNRDNTDFMADVLTGIGRRKCFLVYRVYPSFSEAEVREHALIVAKAIYGAQADQYVLGVYRADEDNRVAAGECEMSLHPVVGRHPGLPQALGDLDAQQLRLELFASVFEDTLHQAAVFLERARTSRDQLQLYLTGLQAAESRCIHEALQHFPMDRVLRRFYEIWGQSDPSHVKFLRHAGNVVEFPFKVIFGVAGWARKHVFSEKAVRSAATEYSDSVEQDLIAAASRLQTMAASSRLAIQLSADDPTVKPMLDTVVRTQTRNGLQSAQPVQAEFSGEAKEYTFHLEAHPLVAPEQQRLRESDFSATLRTIVSQKSRIIGFSKDIDQDLQRLADHFRTHMGVWAKVTQTFWALLNVLPATVAVTYVLSTGDVVGATGIKVKLTGLFGAKDLYALLAIPATSGIKGADRKQLQAMLAPIARTWFEHKLRSVQGIFEQNLTGDILGVARDALSETGRLICEIEESVHSCHHGIRQTS
jgi:hypothetical protein